MLNPFQIRDLHRSPSQENIHGPSDLLSQEPHALNPRSRPGTVQLSASEYNELASKHPRARLTYLDDDDGETITVGSSLELSQRLDEPLDGFLDQQEHIQQSTAPGPMHIFDIRRSNSVTELWKQYEYKSRLRDTEEKDPVVESPSIKPASPQDQAAPTSSASGNTGLLMEDGSESLLAAFELEMAKMLSIPGSSNGSSARETPSDTGEPTEPASSDRRSHPSAAFTHAVHSLINGAGLIGSELRSRLPELEHRLEHHLGNAQRTIPENVGSTMQAALTTLENQMRHLTTALNNASVANAANAARNQNTRSLFQGEMPTPAQTVDTLYSMASEFGQMGYTLFSAFETEFGARNASLDSDEPVPEANSSRPDPETQVPGSSDSSPEIGKDTKGASTTNAAAIDPESKPHEHESKDSDAAQAVPSQESGNAAPHHDSFELPRRHQSWNRLSHQPQRHPQRHPRFRPHPHHHHHHHHPPPPPPPPPHRQHPHPPPPPPPHHGHPPPPGHDQPHPFPPPPPHPPHPHHPSSMSLPSWRVPPPFPPPFPHHLPGGPGQWYPHWPSFTSHRQRDLGSSAVTAKQASHSNQGETAPDHSADTVLFIGNVGFNVSEQMIRNVFAAKGFLVDVHLPLDSDSRKHAGFGYLHFPSIHAASAALDALQGTHIDGHSVNLEFTDHSPIKTVRPEQQSEPTIAPEPSELQSSSIAPAETKIEKVEVKFNDIGESHTTAEERRSVPLSVADLCSSERSAVQRPRGKEALSTTSGEIPDLTRDLEQCRFPPVSQLDAHVLTNQHRDGDSQRGQLFPGKRHSKHGSRFPDRWSTLQSPPGSFPEDDSDETRPGPSSGPAKPRRSKSMRFSNHGGNESPPKPLRRRATERQSLRSDPQNGQSGFHDTACAYDNYTTTFGNSHSQTVPQSQVSATLLDEDVEQADARQRAIDDCVTALVGLGYGSTNAGGYQRMAVYAAAADGRISDAIDLIEEERKVYEQQGSLI